MIEPTMHGALPNDRKTFTTSPVRVLVYTNQKKSQEVPMKIKQAESSPSTLSQKLKQYSSVHLASPSFRFYPKLRTNPLLKQSASQIKEEKVDFPLGLPIFDSKEVNNVVEEIKGNIKTIAMVPEYVTENTKVNEFLRMHSKGMKSLNSS